MVRRRGIVVALVVTLACFGTPLATAAGESELPEEDAVVVGLNPATTDTVTVFLPEDETEDPRARARRLAAAADIPVYDVSVDSVEDHIAISVNGQVVTGGQSYYQTNIETELGTRTGALEYAIQRETLAAVAPRESPNVTVVTQWGTGVPQAESRSRSLVTTRHEMPEWHRLSGDELAYRFPTRNVLVLFALLCSSFLAPYALVRRRSQAVKASDEPVADRVHRLRRLREHSILGSEAVVLVAAWAGALSLTSFLAGTLPWSPISGDWWRVSLWFVALAPFAGAPWLAASLAVLPAYRDLHGSGESRRAVVTDWVRSFSLTVASLWVAAVVIATFSERIVTDPPFGAAVVGTLVLLQHAVTPLQIRLFNDVRPITGELRDEIDAFAAEQDVRLRGVYRIDTGDSLEANGYLAGLPRRYWVFLTDDLIDGLDPDAMRATVAHKFGHLRKYHLVKRVAFATVFWFFVLLVNAAVFESWLFLGLVYFCYRSVGLAAVIQSQEYEADQYAATATSPESMISALDQIASVNTLRRGSDAPSDLLNNHPATSQRIERLRERAQSSTEQTDGKS